ncbi:hypothetical protein V6N12_013207 [Hibiscus sabdariffa]|uniref:Uncharacterized protein n=1 Tax=Hibiscus sabdariffa TaxID=183260 RepID=A0ABR2D5U8_9ROSI
MAALHSFSASVSSVYGIPPLLSIPVPNYAVSSSSCRAQALRIVFISSTGSKETVSFYSFSQDYVCWGSTLQV